MRTNKNQKKIHSTMPLSSCSITPVHNLSILDDHTDVGVPQGIWWSSRRAPGSTTSRPPTHSPWHAQTGRTPACFDHDPHENNAQQPKKPRLTTSGGGLTLKVFLTLINHFKM